MVRPTVPVRAVTNVTCPSANATVLFPAVVKGKHNTLFLLGHTSPDVLFEIAILSVPGTTSEAHAAAEGASAGMRYQALLTHGLVTKQRTAAVGDMSASGTGAMESLLAVLCFELGKRKDDAVEAIAEKGRARSLGGYVDGGLFQKVGLAKKMKGKGKKKA